MLFIWFSICYSCSCIACLWIGFKFGISKGYIHGRSDMLQEIVEKETEAKDARRNLHVRP